MDLCQVAKLEGRDDQRLIQAFFRVFWKMGRKSNVGIFNEEGTVMFLVDVASRSAVSLPRILMWLGTQRNLTAFCVKKSWYVRNFIIRISGEIEELNGIDWRESRHDWESETIKNFREFIEKINWSAWTMAWLQQ
jgi:hypothetical protein